MTRRRFGDVRITRPRVERYGLGRSVETCAPVTTSGQRIRVCISRPEKPGAVISDYSQVCRVLRHAVSADRESLYALHLDRQNRLIGVEEVARGTIGSVETSPREVFKAAILSNAAALILAHNHPSGQPFPSQDDFNITDKLVAVGRLLGIPVHDHVIVAAEGCVSIRETRPAGFGGARRRRRVVP
jgi:DNA repair protein RadC